LVDALIGAQEKKPFVREIGPDLQSAMQWKKTYAKENLDLMV
jgi:hypothetical protein